jgi:hypothetical protein
LKRYAAVLAAVAAIGCGRDVDTSWQQADGHRWRALNVPRGGKAGFTAVDSAKSRVAFVNEVPDSLLERNRVLAHGAGACIGDVNGDDLPDVFLARTMGASALYKNLGALRFEDATSASGIATKGHTTGCTFADVNGDGHLDLIALSLGGPNMLFVNDGTGRFTEDPAAGLQSTAGSTTATVSDVNGDGWLDVFIANYKSNTTLDRISPQERSFDQMVRQTGPREFVVKEQYRNEYKLTDRVDLGGISLSQRADPDAFYINAGAGKFKREAMAKNRRFLDEAGKPLASEPEDFGLAAMFADVTGDRAPDLYIANDFEDQDQFWINDGRGNFRLAPWTALRATSNSGMAVDVGDINRDGHPDLFQVDMLANDSKRLKTQIPTHSAPARYPGMDDVRLQMQRNTMQLSRGDGTFAEIARFAGVGASGWSWSTAFIDVDLDGWEDILVGTGHRWDVMDGDTQYRLRNRLQEIDWRKMLFQYPPLPLPNVAYRNRGDLTFEDVSKTWGFDIGPDVSHGMALGDLDGDGDLDVVINRLGSPAAVLSNNSSASRVAVRLKGDKPNTHGIGAVVRVLGGAVPSQQREMLAGGLYLSSSDAELVFATGAADSVTIEVDWRDGRRSVIEGAKSNRLYEISQATAAPQTAAPPTAVSPIFADATEQLGGHRHTEPYFDDYTRQALLPNALSTLGPGVAWIDVAGDGTEELFVGTGRGGRLARFRNDGKRLRAATTPYQPAHVDLTTLLGWPDGRGGQTLIAGASSYEMSSMPDALGVPSVVSYSPANGALDAVTKGDSASVGALAAADYDGDGNLDLFVGGRVIPRSYGRPASSRLFRGGRTLALDGDNTKLLDKIGMVSAATFADITGDGWPELIVAIEWGEVLVFINERGKLRPASMPGLQGVTSRWNGVATGDLDGDGRLDIVATSWGRNSDLVASAARPAWLYTFASNRGEDVLVAQRDARTGLVAPLISFARLGVALPSSAVRLRTFSAFADASIDQVLGPRASTTASRLAANTSDHTVFLNRDGRFEARALPAEAQLAPASSVSIADFDGDGNEDVLLGQNFFATEIAVPRFDAGRGLLMLGDGKGGFSPLGADRSGIRAYGEQRGVAYADFDRDGRLDVVISQNGSQTQLYRGVGGTPGLRVRLVGKPGNPTVVGTQVRLQYGAEAGPAREVQSGSGYWSQNGAIQVLGRRGAATAVWVRWPGGTVQVVPLTADQREVVIQQK